MSDVFTKSKRSEVMSRIRSHGNKDTEVALAKWFRRNQITGWRRQVKIQVTRDQWRVASKRRASALSLVTRHSPLAVRPDFVFLKSRTAVFVDGCFWHGCPRHGTQPKSHGAFWRKKISGNQARDRRVNGALRRAGWRVVRIWECALRRAGRNPLAAARLVQRVSPG
jgi:DNA mismatch endonuclease (patch repair protein)